MTPPSCRAIPLAIEYDDHLDPKAIEALRPPATTVVPATMSAADGAACARAFAPRPVYPYHSSGTDVAAFARALDGSGIEVRVRDWYAK